MACSHDTKPCRKPLLLENKGFSDKVWMWEVRPPSYGQVTGQAATREIGRAGLSRAGLLHSIHWRLIIIHSLPPCLLLKDISSPVARVRRRLNQGEFVADLMAQSEIEDRPSQFGVHSAWLGPGLTGV